MPSEICSSSLPGFVFYQLHQDWPALYTHEGPLSRIRTELDTPWSLYYIGKLPLSSKEGRDLYRPLPHLPLPALFSLSTQS